MNKKCVKKKRKRRGIFNARYPKSHVIKMKMKQQISLIHCHNTRSPSSAHQTFIYTSQINSQSADNRWGKRNATAEPQRVKRIRTVKCCKMCECERRLIARTYYRCLLMSGVAFICSFLTLFIYIYFSVTFGIFFLCFTVNSGKMVTSFQIIQ